jgi:transposase-like protein
MERPDLDTLACVNSACQRFRHPGENTLTVRKVYGRDGIRLLRWRTCCEEFSERRGTALFNPKRPEAKAEDVITHLDEGCSVRATARLVQVSKETVARLVRAAGRHAERLHDHHVHDLRPLAVAFDEQGSFVKKSKNAAGHRHAMPQATSGTIQPWRLTASSWGR